MQHDETFLRILNCQNYLKMLELSDANLQTDDGCNFDINRFALSMSSDYFGRMFLGMGKNRRTFHIPGISGECLSDILCYVYAGDIRVTERNVEDLIIGADYLLLDDLQMKIKGNILDNLTEVNCLRILHGAHLISDEDIFRKCFKFIQTRFTGVMLCAKDDLTDLPLDILRRILSNPSLCVYGETAVWQAIVAWTQKDIPLRMSCVPQLLLTLAMEDVGEELATEILQHEILSENCLVKDSVEITSSSNESSTNLDVLLTLFRSYSNRFAEPILRHRIPLQLFAAWSHDDEGEMNLYVTHDENTDLWRKITGLRLWPDGLIAIEHNVDETPEHNIIDTKRKICINFDLLSAMKYVRKEILENANGKMHIVSTDAYKYFLIEWTQQGLHFMSVVDNANGSSSTVSILHKIYHFEAAAAENRIYVVGKSGNSDAMMTQMYDPATQQWSILSPTTACHTEFSLVACRRKIYLIDANSSDSSAEVFCPATNLWKELPGDSRTSARATVINDRIIVTEKKGDYMRWNKMDPSFEEFIKQIPSMETH